VQKKRAFKKSREKGGETEPSRGSKYHLCSEKRRTADKKKSRKKKSRCAESENRPLPLVLGERFKKGTGFRTDTQKRGGKTSAETS